jgi:hypothetical protein
MVLFIPKKRPSQSRRQDYTWRNGVDRGCGYLNGFTIVRHGKSPFLIGKPSINRPFSMAMLNNQMVTMENGIPGTMRGLMGC